MIQYISLFRTLLIDFRKPTGLKNTHPEMFHWLYEHFSNRKKQFIPPVYIQHEGNYCTVFFLYVVKS